MSNSYLILAGVALVAACMLAVYGGGEWAASRIAQERGVYERIIGRKLRRLFLSTTPQEFFIYHIIFVIGMVGLSWYMVGSLLLGVPIGLAIGFILPSFWLDRMWNKRIDALEEQVEEAMIFMSNSFKANPALPEAMQDVCNSMGPPISQELAVALREYKLGTPLDQALINLQERVPSRNLQLAVAALLVGRNVGGNIPTILEDIASTIRESFRLERFIDSQTAQGKMQAWVMGAAPAAVCLIFYLMDPAMITPLFTTFLGYIVVAVALVFNIIGVVLILKIIAIDV